MADLPDYYTLTQISEAEAASFKGGLLANRSLTPVSRQCYLATDTSQLFYCVVDGTWVDITHACLLLAGGTMTGAIAMGTNSITGLPHPTGTGHATRKSYVDGLHALCLLLTGGTMSGNIAMGGNKVTGLGAPAAAGDAARKTETDLLTLLTTFNDHSARHEDTGADEISVAALSGVLADDQHVIDGEVLAVAAALLHASRHIPGGADPMRWTANKILLGGGVGADPTLVDMPDSGEGHITILPYSYSAIGQGTWAISIGATEFLNGLWHNTTKNDGDNISYNVYLDAGTYTLGMLCLKVADAGIVDLDVDAVEVASFDLYDAGTVRNSWQTQAAIAVATAGLKTLRVRLHGKNASSTDYRAFFSYITLWRTA